MENKKELIEKLGEEIDKQCTGNGIQYLFMAEEETVGTFIKYSDLTSDLFKAVVGVVKKFIPDEK